MAEAEKAAAAAANGGGLTQEQLAAIVAAVTPAIAQAVGAAVKPLADTQKALAEQLAAQPGGDQAKKGEVAAAAAKQAAEPKYLTGEDLVRVLDEREKRNQQTAEQSAARQKFIGERLKNFPAAYAERLGSDPAKFEAEAKQIGDQFKADAGKFGWKIPDVGGDQGAGGGASPAAAQPDLSKLSPQRLAEMGLQQNKAAAGKPAGAGAGGGAAAGVAATA